jgi:hypothetical protein
VTGLAPSDAIMMCGVFPAKCCFPLVDDAGFEPATSSLQGTRGQSGA